MIGLAANINAVIRVCRLSAERLRRNSSIIERAQLLTHSVPLLIDVVQSCHGNNYRTRKLVTRASWAHDALVVRQSTRFSLFWRLKKNKINTACVCTNSCLFSAIITRLHVRLPYRLRKNTNGYKILYRVNKWRCPVILLMKLDI